MMWMMRLLTRWLRRPISANADLTHRYYQLKAKWMGIKQLNWWDRNARLPGDDDRQFSWDEARHIVLDAFAGFDPKMAEIAAHFSAIIGLMRPHVLVKVLVPFRTLYVPSAHPYILDEFCWQIARCDDFGA